MRFHSTTRFAAGKLPGNSQNCQKIKPLLEREALKALNIEYCICGKVLFVYLRLYWLVLCLLQYCISSSIFLVFKLCSVNALN